MLSALELLGRPEKTPLGAPVFLICGEDSYLLSETANLLQSLLLKGEDAEFSLTSFDGTSPNTDFKTVQRDLATRAMFGGSKKVVRVRDAEKFISSYLDRLEAYLKEPSRDAVLILEAKNVSPQSNFFKAVSKKGCVISAKVPESRELEKWLVQRAKSRGIKLTAAGAKEMIRMLGDSVGILDNELARLALIFPPDKSVDKDEISSSAGSWRTQTAWGMIEHFFAGRVREGLIQLDRLYKAGEDPIGILAQVAATCRRLAKAARIFIHGGGPLCRSAQEQKKRMREALIKVKTPPFLIDKSVDQLSSLGLSRADSLCDRLVTADLAMKGNSRADPKVILQKFLIELGHPDLRNKRPF